jgi:hypothetical protein
MTISRSRTGLFASLMLTAACAGSPAGDPAMDLGKRFCTAVMAGDELASVALMVPDLQEKVRALKAFDAGWRTRNPDQKPPLGDGLRLTAWQDAPQSCAPEAGAPGTVVLTYAPAGAPAEVWRDTLVLEGQGARLAVTDIRYEPRTGGNFRAWVDEALRSPG